MLQIPDLNAMFSGDPGAFGMGRRMLGLNEMFAMENQRRQQEELALRRQSEERINRNTEGQLELQRRGADQREREWNEQAPTRELNRKKIESDLELDALERPVKADEIASRAERRRQQDQLDRVRNMGTAMNQAAALAGTMGPRAAKDHLAKFGFEGWDDRWDTLPPEQLGKVLGSLGERITKGSQDFQQNMERDRQKQEAARLLDEQRNRARAALAERQGQIRAAINAAKQQVQKGERPAKSMEELAARLSSAALTEQDPDMRAWLNNEAAKALDASKFIRATPPEKTQLNPEAVGGGLLERTGGARPNPLQGNPPPQRPNVGNNPAVPPSSGSGASDRALRQALQQNNIPYEPEKFEYRIMPDGRVARRPKQGN